MKLRMPANSTEIGFLLLRVAMGGMLFYFHGYDKLKAAIGYLFRGQEWGFVGFVGSLGFPLPSFFAVCAALAESIGGLLLAVGLFTRYSSIFVCFTMLVAVYHHSRTDGRIEGAAVYAVAALFFFFAGSGKYALDAKLRK